MPIHRPFEAPRLPLRATNIGAGSVGSAGLSVIHDHEGLASDFTTTVVNATVLDVMVEPLFIPPGPMALCMGYSVTAKYSSTDFRFEYDVYITKDDNANSWYKILSSVLVPVATDRYDTMSQTVMIDIQAQLPNLIPGHRDMSLDLYVSTSSTGTTTLRSGIHYNNLWGFVIGKAGD